MFELLAFLSYAIFMIFALISILSISKKKLRKGAIYSVLPITLIMFISFAMLDVEEIKNQNTSKQQVVRNSTKPTKNSLVQNSNTTDNANLKDTVNNKSVPQQQQNVETMVWITATGDGYHSNNNCGNTDTSKATQISLEKAKRSYKACSKCHPPQ